MTFDDVRRLAGALPDVTEGTSYGTPAFHLKKKFMLRLKEDGETIAIKIPMDMRDMLIEAKPATFYITDHYRAYPAVLIRLKKVKENELRDLLQASWEFIAPKKKGRAPKRTR